MGWLYSKQALETAERKDRNKALELARKAEDLSPDADVLNRIYKSKFLLIYSFYFY